MEPDQCLLLPFAGSRRDAGAGTCLRARNRHRGARYGEGESARCRGRVQRRRWRASRSSSMPACASSPRCARCAPSSIYGTKSARSATASKDPTLRRFRYGVQVNSLGLTEQQPENNVYRILLYMLAVVAVEEGAGARRAASGLERGAGSPAPWDQQWSLRMQQIVAYETDLLEFGDIFDGSRDIEAQGRGAESRGARAELGPHRRRWAARSRPSIELHEAAPCRGERRRAVEDRDGRADRGRRQQWHETEPSPLVGGADGIIQTVPEFGRDRAGRGAASLARQRATPRRSTARSPISLSRAGRPQHHGAVDRLRQSRRHDRRMGRDLARGIRRVSRADRHWRAAIRATARARAGAADRRRRVRQAWAAASSSSLASRASTATRTAPNRSPCAPATVGMDVVYEGIRLTPAQIVKRRSRKASTSSASRSCQARMCRSCATSWSACGKAGLGDVPVVVGGIIPAEDVKHA